MPSQIIRLPDVCQRVGLSRDWIYAAMARGEFPRQVKLGPRLVGWLEVEVDAWIAARAAKREPKAAA
jgi:prophage regulatory protein